MRTRVNLKYFFVTELEPDTITIRLNSVLLWLNQLSFDVTDTDKKKGLMYLDGYERDDVVAYRKGFCDRWFNRYLPRMTYFEANGKVPVEPDLNGDQKIVPVFHDESTFRANEDQRHCRLEPNERI